MNVVVAGRVSDDDAEAAGVAVWLWV